MTEFEKMRSEQLYNYGSPEIQASEKHVQEALLVFNSLCYGMPEYRKALKELVPSAQDDTVIRPPFHCDHGHGILLGKNVFINYDCTFLDGGTITIGDNVKIGPHVQIYTPQHPSDFELRRDTVETTHSVTIGEDVWIGGNATILPGVTIGARTIIGAGSVVVHDIPSDCVAVGNPCRVVKKL